jgi:hypothetical protein
MIPHRSEDASADRPHPGLAAACRRVAGVAEGRHLHEVDTEHLALLAAGRLEEIPERDRPKLFDAVAADPQLATVVSDLAAPGILEDGRDEPLPMRTGRWRDPRPWRLALAACGLIAAGLLLWRVADPPGTPRASRSIELLGPATPADPVDAAVSGEEWTRGDMVRDAILLAMLVACGIVAWPALRDLEKPAARA